LDQVIIVPERHRHRYADTGTSGGIGAAVSPAEAAGYHPSMPAPARQLRTASDDAPTVVMITKDRKDEALRAVQRLLDLPDGVRVILVDNGSSDGTADAIRSRYGSEVVTVALPKNLGAGARNIGVHLAATPYVAFCDDDSSWAPGALGAAAHVLADHPRLGLLAARVLVGDDQIPDPVCDAMAATPLPADDDLPGPAVLGFIACGAVVRRTAFLEAGGFDARYGVGGEEGPLAIELASRGWQLAYVSSVVARHWPSPVRDRHLRRRTVLRNALWLAWRRRRWPSAIAQTVRCLMLAATDATARAALAEAIFDGRAIMDDRRPVDRALERRLRLVDGARRSDGRRAGRAARDGGGIRGGPHGTDAGSEAAQESVTSAALTP
jgi:GT2 family glycosyltransferase